jgi:hypothetical protein
MLSCTPRAVVARMLMVIGCGYRSVDLASTTTRCSMMKHTALASIVLLSLSSTGCVRAQTDLDAAALRNDFRYLVMAIEQTHPDPYTAFGSKLLFHRTVQEYLDHISDSLSLNQFRDLVEQFMAVLGDGHTVLNSPPTPDAARRLSLPLAFGIATDGIFVYRAAVEYQHLVGSRVLRIASLSLDSLMRIVRRTTPSENRYGTYRNLTRMLRYDNLARRMFAAFTGSLPLTLESLDHDTVAVELTYRADVDLVPRNSRAGISAHNGLLYWNMIGEQEPVGYFAWHGIVSREVAEASLRNGNMESVNNTLNWIYSFLRDTPRSGNVEEDIARAPGLYERFRALLEHMKARGGQYLIIDLRRNGGGMTPLVRPLMYMLYGDEFLAHDFQPEYYTLISPLLLEKWGVESVDEYNQSNGTDFRVGDYRFFRFWPSDASQSAEERRALDNITYFSQVGAEYVEDLGGTPVYTPHIIVLISPDTFSAAYHFMYFLWDMGGATVLGVPSRQAGNAFMETTPFTLPHTRLEGSISNAMQVFFPNDAERGKVFMPDFPMTWHDFARFDFDAYAEVLYALEVIEEGAVAQR